MRDSSKKGGYKTVCRDCTRRRNAGEIPKGAGGETFENLEQRRQWLLQGLKECCGCHVLKIISEFGLNKGNKDGLQRWCTPCRKQAYAEKYREKSIVKAVAWGRANPTKRREIMMRDYRKNKARCFAQSAIRRAQKKNAIPEWAKDCPVEKQRVKEIYEDAKAITQATGVLQHVDHIIPLAAGGLHVSSNLQIISAKENLSKNSSYKGVQHGAKRGPKPKGNT